MNVLFWGVFWWLSWKGRQVLNDQNNLLLSTGLPTTETHLKLSCPSRTWKLKSISRNNSNVTFQGNYTYFTWGPCHSWESFRFYGFYMRRSSKSLRNWHYFEGTNFDISPCSPISVCLATKFQLSSFRVYRYLTLMNSFFHSTGRQEAEPS